MGPRFCKRGNYWVEAAADYERELQWGHAFVSVETLEARPHVVPLAIQLQWGHAFVSVETRDAAQFVAVHVAASMGPRFCKRGNPDK